MSRKRVVPTADGGWKVVIPNETSVMTPGERLLSDQLQELRSTITQQAAWIEVFREFTRADDYWHDHHEGIHDADNDAWIAARDRVNAARAAITPEVMGEQPE